MRAVLCLALIAAGCRNTASGDAAPPDTQTEALFIRGDARAFRLDERAGAQQMVYQVPEPYPASRFLCQLTTYLVQHQWSALREDPLNPGTPTSFVRGWSDFTNGVRQPETHDHTWSGWWTNDHGDLLMYGLSYSYPENSPAVMDTLHVAASVWHSDVDPRLLPVRVGPLSVLSHPVQAVGTGPECAAPQWTAFVQSAVTPHPVAGLSSETGPVRSIEIMNEIDGMAARMATELQMAVPGLKVSTPLARDASAETPTAYLNFQFACRCDDKRHPVMYVTEAVLYSRGFGLDWDEPARVLYYWSRRNAPPASNDDLGFVPQLASVFVESRVTRTVER